MVGCGSGVAFRDISPSWLIGSSFESKDSWLASQRFGILKCRYCLPLMTSLSPITAALFLGFKLLAFFIVGIKIFLLISRTRFGRSSLIIMFESLRLRHIFHTLLRSLRQVNRAIIGIGRPRLCLPRWCIPQNWNRFTSSRFILRYLVITSRTRPLQSSSCVSGICKRSCSNVDCICLVWSICHLGWLVLAHIPLCVWRLLLGLFV